MKRKPAILALADGTVFEGQSFGFDGETVGEVVFNTSMTGYQEMITDSSYAGQIITLTYPHIGNVGCNEEDNEFSKPWSAGLIVRDVPAVWSNWRGTESLEDFLKRYKLVGITGIDTRHLIHHLREKGAQAGCISSSFVSHQEAIAKAQAFPNMEGSDLAALVSTKVKYEWTQGSGTWALNQSLEKTIKNIVVYDYGVKQHILEILIDLGARVTVVPAKTPVEEVLAMNPDGIVLSNGPGDPKVCDYAISAIKILLEKNIPLLGICLGFQLMALAAGASTFKMKFGHHGANHPVSCLEEDNRVMITSQNHGFAVDENTLPDCFRVTHRSLFDQSLQGFCHQTKPFFAFQGHPEASPGPQEAYTLFEKFFVSIRDCI